MDEVFKFLQSKRKTNGTAPKRFDECLYTPYVFTYPISPPHPNSKKIIYQLPEMFLFDYGVVVFWGMTLKEEQRILKLLVPFEEEKLGKSLSCIAIA